MATEGGAYAVLDWKTITGDLTASTPLFVVASIARAHGIRKVTTTSLEYMPREELLTLIDEINTTPAIVVDNPMEVESDISTAKNFFAPIIERYRFEMMHRYTGTAQYLRNTLGQLRKLLNDLLEIPLMPEYYDRTIVYAPAQLYALALREGVKVKSDDTERSLILQLSDLHKDQFTSSAEFYDIIRDSDRFTNILSMFQYMSSKDNKYRSTYVSAAPAEFSIMGPFVRTKMYYLPLIDKKSGGGVIVTTDPLKTFLDLLTSQEDPKPDVATTSVVKFSGEYYNKIFGNDINIP